MYRIIGILAIVGFIIILLPFFISNNDAPSEPAIVKAPPFPNQDEQSNLDLPHDTIDQTHSMPVPADPVQAVEPAGMVPAAPSSITPVSPPNPSQEEQSDVAPSDEDSNEATLEPRAEVTHKPIIGNSLVVASAVEKAAPTSVMTKPSVPIKEMSETLSKKPLIASLQNPADDHGLLKLKSPAWVIQVGSFKNKTNALRLVNQLRGNGYKAFIQSVSSAFGENTRVYIGPEFKQASAKMIANQIEQDMHLHGIVLNFKPLTM